MTIGKKYLTILEGKEEKKRLLAIKKYCFLISIIIFLYHKNLYKSLGRLGIYINMAFGIG